MVMPRSYDMSKRSAQAAETSANIVAATERLLASVVLDEISLNTIAEEAGVTVQTVLRHMDSKDGCFEAVVEVLSERVEQQRGITDYRSIDEAISDLVDHFEAEGKLMLNLLAQEGSGNPFISDVMQRGRSYHRRWVRRCFPRHLCRGNRMRIDALVVATDIYAWKLLRLDLGRNPHVVKKVLTSIVKNILEAA